MYENQAMMTTTNINEAHAPFLNTGGGLILKTGTVRPSANNNYPCPGSREYCLYREPYHQRGEAHRSCIRTGLT
ncbi:hypothetical protein Pmani_030228 [Petrolisthes manimaculis]|uniref:Uncharacterized protein n=1 Tax=Petrolisthes manimaculis TaxID=1843537 RepID=A0AAE1TT31_9EUCA|nr:hypothetical protein Pmani_030228 [Petrolisthes manimaculis]